MDKQDLTSTLPYLPEGRQIQYVSSENEFMQVATEVKNAQSLDPAHPTGAVLVREGQVLAVGANGSDHHEVHGCERKRQGIPTGQGYDLCQGCHPDNHAEARAIAKAQVENIDIRGSDLYLDGHWWCCEGCWEKMIEAGVERVFLCENAERDHRK
jgi:dCMP deaminase